jgi:hypothetical protein
MGKYAPLGEFLRNRTADQVSMSFADVERITGAKLPAKARSDSAWWSNEPAKNAMAKVWLAAGFQAERVDVNARLLVFRRIGQADQTKDTPSKPQRYSPENRHPMYGAMKGLVQIMPGVDLTEPADPSWGDVWDEAK